MKLRLIIDNTFYNLKVGDKIPLNHPNDLYTVLKITPTEDGRSEITMQKPSRKVDL